jgi:biopolymer transport protein ExbB/TolQ
MDRDAYVMMSIEELNTELTKFRNSKPKLQQLIDELIAYKRENPNDASLLSKLQEQTTLSRRNATTQPNLPHELRQAYRSARQSSVSRQSGGKTRKHSKSRKHRKSRRRR